MDRYHLPRYEELPEIRLFSDQIVSYIESKLQPFFIEENFFTRSMINNYVKQGLVDPPIKKKYGRTHMVYFIAVCLLKKSFTLDEIDLIIKKLIEHVDIPTAYNYFCDELEACMKGVFLNEEIQHVPYENPNPQVLYACQNILLALTHKVYAQSVLQQLKGM